MVKVIGVRFRTAGKIYYFDPLNFQVKRGDHVIVETARGVEYGTVVGSPREVEDDKVVQPLKPVLRVATERDDEQEAGNKAKEKEAFKICQEKIRKHGLEMKLIDAEYTFDNNKVLFYSNFQRSIHRRGYYAPECKHFPCTVCQGLWPQILLQDSWLNFGETAKTQNVVVSPLTYH